MARRILRAALTGLVAGVLILGIGGRVAMRAVAIIIHQTAHFGPGATLGILMIGAILGVLTGVLYGVLFEDMWRDRVAVKGVLYGTLLFVVLVLTQPPAIRAEVAAARSYMWQIALLFWAVSVLYATVLASRLRAPASHFARVSV